MVRVSHDTRRRERTYISRENAVGGLRFSRSSDPASVDLVHDLSLHSRGGKSDPLSTSVNQILFRFAIRFHSPNSTVVIIGYALQANKIACVLSEDMCTLVGSGQTMVIAINMSIKKEQALHVTLLSCSRSRLKSTSTRIFYIIACPSKQRDSSQSICRCSNP